MDKLTAFSTNLRKLRKAKKYTLEEFAELIQKSYKQCSKYENDSALPGIDTLVVICQILDCSYNDLLGIYLDKDFVGAAPEEKELIQDVISLKDRDKRIITNLIKTMKNDTLE